MQQADDLRLKTLKVALTVNYILASYDIFVKPKFLIPL